MRGREHATRGGDKGQRNGRRTAEDRMEGVIGNGERESQGRSGARKCGLRGCSVDRPSSTHHGPLAPLPAAAVTPSDHRRTSSLSLSLYSPVAIYRTRAHQQFHARNRLVDVASTERSGSRCTGSSDANASRSVYVPTRVTRTRDDTCYTILA